MMRSMVLRYLNGNGVTYYPDKQERPVQNNEDMKSDRERITTIKKLIKIELSRCNPHLWPNVCELQGTQEGYRRIEEMVIRYAADEGMPIGSAIALIEQEFAHAKS